MNRDVGMPARRLQRVAGRLGRLRPDPVHVLGLVLAHDELVADRRGEPPLLLLDEVAAHLDPKRRAALFTRLMSQSATIAMGFEKVEHAPSLQLAEEFHRQMLTWCDEFKAFAKTNISTLVMNGRRTAENVTRNLAWYVATPSLARLKDAYKGKPAVIVSAGPSGG